MPCQTQLANAFRDTKNISVSITQSKLTEEEINTIIKFGASVSYNGAPGAGAGVNGEYSKESRSVREKITQDFCISYQQSHTLNNNGTEYMTVLALDTRGRLVKKICSNYRMEPDRSYIFDTDGNIHVQMYGAPHFTDQHERNWRN